MTEQTFTKIEKISQKRYSVIAHKLEDIIDHTFAKNHFLNLNDNSALIPSHPADFFRIFLESFNENFAVRNLIANSISQIEKNSGGLCSILYASILSKKLTHSDLEISDIVTEKRPKRISFADFQNGYKPSILGEYFGSKANKKIISSIKVAGALGSLKIECGDNEDMHIVDGCRFSVNIPTGFAPSFRKIKMSNVSILIFEGTIESVSELHHLLEQASSTNKSMIIFATSFNPEVAHTLSKNIEMGKLKVIPLEVSKELEDLNQIHDISFLTKSLPITVGNARKIGMQSLHDLPEVENIDIDIHKKEVTLQVEFPRIIELRNRIKLQIDKEEIQDRIDLLEKRLNCLGFRRVKLVLKSKKHFEGIIQDRLNSFMSLLAVSAREGVVETFDHIHPHIKNNFSYLPYDSMVSSIKRALSDGEQILKIGAVVSLF